MYATARSFDGQPATVEPFTPTRHGEVLHSAGSARNHVVIARKLSGRGWRQRAYKVEDLPDALSEMTGTEDAYISQGRFFGYRREVAQLAGISALWSDLDFYRVPHLREMHPRGVLEEALPVLEREKVPEPSLAISSGRGLYLLWLHTEVPRQALPRWNACQRRISEVLAPLGADATAKDAARVLRLAGTVNTKSGVVAEAIRPPGEVWEFGDLADEVLPLTREELAEVRDLRIARAVKRPGRRLWTPGRDLTIATLWEARLSDLQLLLRLRWDAEELPPGQRDEWLFLAACAMSWLAADSQVMRRELYSVAREVGHWPDAETTTRMQTLFKRMRMLERGEKVPYGGGEVDPRYRFRTQTIQDRLEITAAEERHMRTLISPAEGNRRRREKAREEGSLSRKDYLDRAARRRLQARSMHEEGAPPEEIAASLGISSRTVQDYLRDAGARRR